MRVTDEIHSIARQLRLYSLAERRFGLDGEPISNEEYLDELGYLPIGKAEANMFFGLISTLYESASVVITSI